jgi:hypothetical protein
MNGHLKPVLSDMNVERRNGADVHTILTLLHERGCSIIDALKVIRTLYALSLQDARAVVESHPLWANTATSNGSIFEQIMQHGPESTYRDWLNDVRFGFKRPIVRTVEKSDEDRKKRIRTLLKSGASLRIEESETSVKDLLPLLLSLFEEGDPSLQKPLMQIINHIGFPQNKDAIPWLIDIALDANDEREQDAIETLRHVPSSEVTPFWVALLLNEGDQYDWEHTVKKVCVWLSSQKDGRQHVALHSRSP